MVEMADGPEHGKPRVRLDPSCEHESEEEKSPPRVNKQLSGLHLGDKDGAMPGFEVMPECLREGPWSPGAYAYLGGIVGWLLWVSGEALGEAAKTSTPELAWEARLLLGALACYTVVVHATTVAKYGSWPYASYTLTAYALLTLRFFAVSLGLSTMAEILRFPVLVMAWTTTLVWWILLVPLLLALMTPDQRRAFLGINFSFMLLNCHLFNLPLAMLDYHLTWRPLVLYDLWVGLIFAMLYLAFYLFVLDPNGIHFYIILSPRRAWCFIPGYTSVLLVYISIYCMLG